LQGDFNGGATNNGKGLGIDSSGNLYIVDGSGAVFRSSNQGVDWTEQSSGYGGGAGTDDLEVDGTIYGNVTGSIDLGFSAGSVIFQGASGLAEDNANLTD